MSDAIRLKCACGHILRLPANAVGRKARCPNCKNIFDVPPSGTVSPPPTAPKPDQAETFALREAPPLNPPPNLALEDIESLPPPPKRAPAPAAPAGPTAKAAIAQPSAGAADFAHPRCREHPDREAARACVGCKAFLCEECSNTYEGITLCETCLTTPERAKTPDMRAAQEALLRKRGVAVGDFTRAFRTRSPFDAFQFALNALTNDGRLLYMAFGVFFAVGSLSGLAFHYARKGDGLNKPIVWAWLLVPAAVQWLTFGGFVGAARDMLFGLPFDIGRFGKQALQGLRVSWLTLPLFVMTGLLTGPNLWQASTDYIPVLKAGGILALSLTIAVPAVVTLIEKCGPGRGLKVGLYHVGNSALSVVGMNLLVGLVTWMWIFTTRMFYTQLSGSLAMAAIVPLLFNGLVVSLVYVVWIIGTAAVYLSQVSGKDIASKAPPVGLPGPRAGITNAIVGVMVGLAIACAAAYMVVPLSDNPRTSLPAQQVGIYSLWPDFSPAAKPAAPPAKGQPARPSEKKK